MILVTGTNGVVGKPLIKHLADSKIEHLCVTRKVSDNLVEDLDDAQNSSQPSKCVHWDLSDKPSSAAIEQLSQCNSLIHCAPIWLLSPQLSVLTNAGIKRLVVFSSTSVISKVDSQNPSEQHLVTLLADAEKAIKDHCIANGIQFTILRPSMIYGYGRDENVSHIAGFIRKRSFMLLMGKASGQRQPVHADDLVWAAMTVLDSDKAINAIYNLAGGEVLSYRAMVERIFTSLDKPNRIVSLPLWLFRTALSLASKFSAFNYTPEMADRMNQNLVYSNDDASDDFDYRPQAFLCNPSRDLP